MGGFYHGSVNSDSYVVLAGGGYKSVNDFLLSQDHYKTSPGAGTAGTSSATSGSTLAVPYVTVNANGHVTAYGTHTHTISGFLTAQDHYKTSPGAGTAGTSSATSGSTLSVPYVTINANGHVTGYGTHTHTISGFLTALDHYKTSPGAGTAGTSSNTSGSTLSVPYVTVNANGHVTAYGTHTHTVTGFLTSHQTVSGTFWGNSWSNGDSLSGKITVAADGWAGQLLLNRTNNGSSWGASIAFQGSGSNRGAIHMEGNELYVGDVSGTFRYKVLTENNWNSTISVTGGDGDTKYYLTLNGTNKGHTSGTSLGSFYAPTSSGTSGYILKSNGSNSAPTWISNSHTLSIATTTDSSSITLAANTKYKLTAGGSTYVFTTPPAGSGGSISISNYSSTFYPCGYTSYSGSNITALKAYSGFYVTSSGAYHTSDIRKKCDIQDIYDDEITKLFNTHHGYIHSFRWRDTDKPAFGFIAQELLEYCPEAVDYNIDTGFYTVNYEMALSKIVGVLFKKIKKQDSEIKKLRKLLENRK